MDRTTTRDVAATIAAGAGVLLMADMSLGWQRVQVSAGQVVDIRATASGWTHLGVVAGLLTIAMLVYMIRPLRRGGAVDLRQAAITALLGLGAGAFGIAEALSGNASVTAPAAVVQVGSRLWPAYVGIALGVLVAAAAVTAFVYVLRGATEPTHAVQPTS